MKAIFKNFPKFQDMINTHFDVFTICKTIYLVENFYFQYSTAFFRIVKKVVFIAYIHKLFFHKNDLRYLPTHN